MRNGMAHRVWITWPSAVERLEDLIDLLVIPLVLRNLSQWPSLEHHSHCKPREGAIRYLTCLLFGAQRLRLN